MEKLPTPGSSRLLALCLALWILPLGAWGGSPSYVIETVAGNDDVGDQGPASQAMLGAVEGLAVDAAGNVYIADNLDHRIRKVTARDQIITTLAGNGHAGYAGDGHPAAQALLNRPYGVAVSAEGVVYIADFGNARVRAITPGGQITTVAGGGLAGARGSALAAHLTGPRNVAVDATGNLYISDFAANLVYKVTPAGNIETVAGTGVAGCGEDGPAVVASLNAPAGLAAGPGGVLYIADSGNGRILRLAGGQLATVIEPSPVGVTLAQPTGIAVDRSGVLYVADAEAGVVLRRSPDGAVTVVADRSRGLNRPRDVALGVAGELFVADGRRVWKIGAEGSMSLFAGGSTSAVWGDGVKATSARLDGPIGVAVDAGGDLYIAEEGRYRIRKVDQTGLIRTVAGTGESGTDGEEGPATAARLVDPVAVAIDGLGRLWIADYLGNRVRRVETDGTIRTIAGNGEPGYDGDAGGAAVALLNRPRDIAADGHGNVYVADSLNHRVRRIDAGGGIATVAGSGVRGYAGDGGLAINAQLDTPVAVAVDAAGNLYIAEAGNNVVRRVTRSGLVYTVAGNGRRGYVGDGGPATDAALNFPSAVAVDAGGRLWIADTNNHCIRRVSAGGRIETIAGDGVPGFGGDGGAAAEARLRFPSDVAVAPDGSVYLADLGNRRIRKLTPARAAPVISTPGTCRVLNGASFREGPVAPGEIVSIFGENLAEVTSGAGLLTGQGTIATTRAGVQVLFNGIAAPLFYVGSSQINVQVPYEVAGQDRVRVEVLQEDTERARCETSVEPAVPGIFTSESGGGHAVVANEDGSLNTPENPARRGSVIVFYATGEGTTVPPIATGKPAAEPLPRPVLPVAVRIAGLPAEILYAGAAPGFVGLMQLNVRIPANFIPIGELKLELFVGGISGRRDVTVSVR